MGETPGAQPELRPIYSMVTTIYSRPKRTLNLTHETPGSCWVGGQRETARPSPTTQSGLRGQTSRPHFHSARLSPLLLNAQLEPQVSE